MNKYLISALFACIFLYGCASTPRSNDAGENQFTSIESAVAGVRPVGQVPLGESIRVKIVENSPYLKKSHSSGRFEVITVNGKAGEAYKLTAFSVCDCFGFKKWAVLPHLYLLDGSKTVIAQDPVILNPRFRSLSGVFPKDDTYYLAIVADAKSEGKKIEDVSIGVALPSMAFVPDLFSVSMTSHPTGVVQIGWAKE